MIKVITLRKEFDKVFDRYMKEEDPLIKSILGAHIIEHEAWLGEDKEEVQKFLNQQKLVDEVDYE